MNRQPRTRAGRMASARPRLFGSRAAGMRAPAGCMRSRETTRLIHPLEPLLLQRLGLRVQVLRSIEGVAQGSAAEHGFGERSDEAGVFTRGDETQQPQRLRGEESGALGR